MKTIVSLCLTCTILMGVGILSFANEKVEDEDYAPVSIRLDITTIGCFRKGTV